MRPCGAASTRSRRSSRLTELALLCSFPPKTPVHIRDTTGKMLALHPTNFAGTRASPLRAHVCAPGVPKRGLAPCRYTSVNERLGQQGPAEERPMTSPPLPGAASPPYSSVIEAMEHAGRVGWESGRRWWWRDGGCGRRGGWRLQPMRRRRMDARRLPPGGPPPAPTTAPPAPRSYAHRRSACAQAQAQVHAGRGGVGPRGAGGRRCPDLAPRVLCIQP